MNFKQNSAFRFSNFSFSTFSFLSFVFQRFISLNLKRKSSEARSFKVFFLRKTFQDLVFRFSLEKNQVQQFNAILFRFKFSELVWQKIFRSVSEISFQKLIQFSLSDFIKFLNFCPLKTKIIDKDRTLKFKKKAKKKSSRSGQKFRNS